MIRKLNNLFDRATYTAEYWEYDSRLGRRWNVDPVVKPWESPYAAFSNNPIFFIDPSGLDSETPFPENPCENDIFTRTDKDGNSWVYVYKDGKWQGAGGTSSLPEVVVKPAMFSPGEVNTASNLPKSPSGQESGDADAISNIALGVTPVGTYLDLYTALTGREYGSNAPINGIWRYAGVIPLVSEFRKASKLKELQKQLRIENVRVLNQGDPSKVFVIGRKMEKRVKPYANAIGAKYYKPILKIQTATSLRNNIRMIQRKLNGGWTIIDIGLDPTDPISSDYYEAEIKEIVKYIEKNGGKFE